MRIFFPGIKKKKYHKGSSYKGCLSGSALTQWSASACFGNLGMLFFFPIIKPASLNSWDLQKQKRHLRKTFYFYSISSFFYKPERDGAWGTCYDSLWDKEQSQYLKGLPFIGVLEDDACIRTALGRSVTAQDCAAMGSETYIKAVCACGSRRYTLVPSCLGLNPRTALQELCDPEQVI